MTESAKADWKDYLALFYAMLRTVVLPLIIIAIILLIAVILLH